MLSSVGAFLRTESGGKCLRFPAAEINLKGDNVIVKLLALGRIFPEQELGADALFECGLIQVVAEAEVENAHAACDEADDIVIAGASLLLTHDDLADGQRIVELLLQAEVD